MYMCLYILQFYGKDGVPMAKYKKRSVAPIYAIALVWVIFTLVHPLYRVSDYVSVILLSGLAFVVAKGIRPTVEYDLPEPEGEMAPQEGSPEEAPAEELTEETPTEGEDLPEPEARSEEDTPDPEP